MSAKKIYHTIEDKLDAYIEYPEDLSRCWRWRGTLQHNGYGRGKFFWEGKHTTPYRALFMLYAGFADIGHLDLDHLCRNPNCVNPKHLQAVPSRTNTLRGKSPPSRNIRATQCPRRHNYTPENTFVNKSGQRSCRECRRAHYRDYYWKNRDRLNKQAVNNWRKREGKEPKYVLAPLGNR